LGERKPRGMRPSGGLAVLVAALLAVLALFVAGCGGDDDDSGDGGGSSGNDYTIGVDLSLASDPFFVAMSDGIKAEANKLGVDTVITYSDYDPNKQLANIQDLVAQQVDGILASPADVEAAIPAFEVANQADIPIMSIADHTDPDVETSFIGAPWDEFGAKIAKWTCDEAGGKGQVAMIKGPAGVSFVEEMEDGYKGYMSSECPGMSIVFEANVPTTSEEALKATQDAFTAHPDLKAVFTQTDAMAPGVTQVVEEQPNSEDILVTGFSGDKTGYDLLRDGSLDMDIALKPYRWGGLGVRTMVDYLNGEEVPQLVRIDTVLIDQSNIDDFTYEEIR
jgi:ribose transport system substrate-binding protein